MMRQNLYIKYTIPFPENVSGVYSYILQWIYESNLNIPALFKDSRGCRKVFFLAPTRLEDVFGILWPTTDARRI